jgi:chromosome segregation ATPase
MIMEEAASPGGESVNPEPSDGVQALEESGNSLETKDAAELVGIIRSLRNESANYRTRAKTAEDSLASLTTQSEELSARLTELESQNKTAEEKEAERIAALEARAASISALEPYLEHVKSQYEAGVAEIDGLKDDEQKTRIKELMESFPENDYLGRLRAIRALQVVQGNTRQLDPGDEGNPAEPGGGASEKSIADMLGWSADGLREARLAGLIK